jgi:hypothetical protein
MRIKFLNFKSRYQNLKKSRIFRINYYNTQCQNSEIFGKRFLVLSYAQSPIKCGHVTIIYMKILKNYYKS